MAAPFTVSVQKCSDWAWTAFSMKMGKHEEQKDKQISSHCISFTAIDLYMFLEMKTSFLRTAISEDHMYDHVIIAESTQSMTSIYFRITVYFPHYMSERERVMWTKLDALLLAQWAPTRRNINLHQCTVLRKTLIDRVKPAKRWYCGRVCHMGALCSHTKV